MLFGISFHIGRRGPKRPDAKLSVYLLPDNVGFSGKRRSGQCWVLALRRRSSGEWRRMVIL